VLRYFWERKTPEQVAADLGATMRYYRTNRGVKSFVLAGFSFGADILPVIYNRLAESDKDNVDLLVFLALGNHADFEVRVAGWLGQTTHEMPLLPELEKMPKDKILCIYGSKEKAATGTACTSLMSTEAKVLELPGGHHFDKDYPKLTRLILESYQQHDIKN
jgi:type IV secretory pathway VirJ component